MKIYFFEGAPALRQKPPCFDVRAYHAQNYIRNKYVECNTTA